VIYAEARDALTHPILTTKVVPGEDRLLWTEVDTEEDIRTDLLQQTNAAMRAVDPYLTVAPWPLPVPRQAPLDYTMRYRGFELRLHQFDQAFGAWAPAPGGRATIAPITNPLDRDQQVMSRMLRPEEIRETAADPTRWIRLPFQNEYTGTVLKEPAWMRWQGMHNGRFTIEVPENDIFEPFDLTKPERYVFVTDDDSTIEHGEEWGAFGDNARLVFYLRPRRWRWIVTVLAHFEHGNWYESVANDEVFISVFYLRPPFYPMRHNIGETAQSYSYEVFNFYGQPRSLDIGLTSAWDLSWHSRELRRQILDQQWFTLCEYYVFTGNEDPDLALVAMPPRVGEIVAGIGFVDEASSRESRIWAKQTADLSSVYPQRTIGQFLLAGWQA